MSDKKCLDKGETPKPPKPEHRFKCARCGASAKKEKRLCKPITLTEEDRKRIELL